MGVVWAEVLWVWRRGGSAEGHRAVHKMSGPNLSPALCELCSMLCVVLPDTNYLLSVLYKGSHVHLWYHVSTAPLAPLHTAVSTMSTNFTRTIFTGCSVAQATSSSLSLTPFDSDRNVGLIRATE